MLFRSIEAAPAARTTVQSPLRWSSDAAWKIDYSNIDLLSADEIRSRRAEFDRQKKIAKLVSSGSPDRDNAPGSGIASCAPYAERG